MMRRLQKKEIASNISLMSRLRLAAPCNIDSIVDGPGLRIVVWTQGCPHHCPFCHNAQTQPFEDGFDTDSDEIIKFIQNSHLQSGITLSGGEPFMQARALIPVAQAAIELGLNVWAYSGFTYEEILADEDKRALLDYVDVLVDGRFINDLKHYKLRFKGSSNQRIIDVKQSLAENKVVFSKYDDENQKLNSLG